MNRTQNATRNIVFGVILKLYQILLPFAMRTAMIYLMGVEYLGLNSLFTSVLQVLNLAELGVGSAMVYSMYKPIAENDKPMVCALLKLYKKYYFFIGLIIACAGVLLTPLIPKLISGTIPGQLNIYILYLLNLAATVMTYWLFAYKNSLLQANQRSDIASKITILTTSLQYALQLVVLWLFHDYYLYIIVMLFTQAMANIVTAIAASRLYPDLGPKGTLPDKTIKTINQRIKDLFTAKLGATIVNSADTIVISAFLGLTVLAMYQNYYFIMSSVMGVLTVVFSSCLAGVGNSMVMESAEKNYNDFRVLTFLINWIVTVCMCCFATVYQPFIELWVGKKYIFSETVVAFFCIYFYLVTMQQVNGMYKDAAGVWHQDRFRPLIAAMVNLLLNLALVRIWGIYAILLSTIISYLFISMPWMVSNVFKYVFHRSWRKFACEFSLYFLVACIITFLCRMICVITGAMPLYVQIAFNLLVSLLASNMLLLIIYKKSAYYIQMINLIDKITKFKFSRILKIFK
ncbi:lipopolysaccharide biosynthesis protein [Bifidobacterium catenulatum]|uniref:lipopolysaccharide biosynthesis protein n=1 Tax=Bifidobacterium catenulatum TaxID=1686 RepID=UPI003D32FF6F